MNDGKLNYEQAEKADELLCKKIAKTGILYLYFPFVHFYLYIYLFSDRLF